MYDCGCRQSLPPPNGPHYGPPVAPPYGPHNGPQNGPPISRQSSFPDDEEPTDDFRTCTLIKT